MEKRFFVVACIILGIVLATGSILGVASAHQSDATSPQWEVDSLTTELAYCREIDSLCFSYGVEIDADAVDICNAASMEEAAAKLIGYSNFYGWRNLNEKAQTYYNEKSLR